MWRVARMIDTVQSILICLLAVAIIITNVTIRKIDRS
jgi:hypothetical protein